MLRRILLYLPLVLLSAACSVYTPLHTPAPLIDGPQQVELSGGLSTPGYLQGAVTYSPLRHVLLRAAYGSGHNDDDTVSLGTVRQASIFRTRQLEAALGTYWRPGPAVLLGGFAGYGRGTGEHWYLKRSGIRGALLQLGPDSVWTYQYAAHYQRLFADAYVRWFNEDEFLSMGFAYHVEHVRFSRYANADVPTGPQQLWRHEPMFFVRLGYNSANGLEDLVHGQFALGYSFSPGFTMPRERAGNRDATEVRKPLPSFTLSLILRPHVLWQNQARRLRTP